MKFKDCIKRNSIYQKYRYSFCLWQTSFELFLLNRVISNFPSQRIRLFLLRSMGSKIDKTSVIQCGCKYWNPKKLFISAGSVIGFRVMLDSRNGIFIGKNVTIATEVMIWTAQHDYNDIHFKAIGKNVIIEDYAWICSRSILLPGVTIGKGAVVASGAVVTKNVEPFTVVGGVPAKKIGMRNTNLDYIPSKYKLHIL